MRALAFVLIYGLLLLAFVLFCAAMALPVMMTGLIWVLLIAGSITMAVLAGTIYVRVEG